MHLEDIGEYRRVTILEQGSRESGQHPLWGYLVLAQEVPGGQKRVSSVRSQRKQKEG